MERSSEVALPEARAPRARGRFTAFHKWDRNFYLIFLALCWLGVLMGFVPAARLRFAGHADYPAPLILEIHAFAFSAWMILLTAQIALIRTHHPRLHMRLGLVGVALVPLMAVSGFLSEVYSQRFRFAHPPDSQAFFIIAIYYVVAFTILAALALAARKNPSAHKRLILLATTVIVGAAYGRWWGTPLFNMFGDGTVGMLINTYAGAEMLMLGAVVYDWRTRGRLHPVYEIGVPAILIGQIATTLIYHSPRWLPIARLAIGH
ncbi:MAG: hypothetical protein ABIW03_03235 [Sphingomicrobium sp.]